MSEWLFIRAWEYHILVHIINTWTLSGVSLEEAPWDPPPLLKIAKYYNTVESPPPRA